MRCEAIFGQDVLMRVDARGHILELDLQQEDGFNHPKDAIVAVSRDDHLIPVLLQELPPPALPADGLIPP